MGQIQNITQSKNFKKIVIITFLTLSFIGWIGLRVYSHYFVSTDDAYINANVVQIAPRVSGKVTHVYVTNNQFVKKGQIIFDLDQDPFQAAVDSAAAQVNVNEAQLSKFSTTAQRTLTLVKENYMSPQDKDDVVASLKAATSNLDYANAQLKQAQLNLAYTKITAPTDGWITNLSLREGDIVNANQPLFALVSNDEFWADANFKETEMEHVKPGQKATVITDLYPNHPFNAVIESISSGAGSAFSLLPPENSTGNWVKVTQRIPVRVRILNPDNQYPLRIGISAEVTVHLHKMADNQSMS
jgi:membrane fusion protein (multidrug efflux system)